MYFYVSKNRKKMEMYFYVSWNKFSMKKVTLGGILRLMHRWEYWIVDHFAVVVCDWCLWSILQTDYELIIQILWKCMGHMQYFVIP